MCQYGDVESRVRRPGRKPVTTMTIYNTAPEEVSRFDALLAEVDEIGRKAEIKVVEKAIRIAENLVQGHPGDSDAYQMLGLAWYYYPRSTSWRSWHCRQALEQALALDPDHQYALQYLACLNFDQERYVEALAHLEQLSPTFFVELGLEDRALKNAELAFVCRLRIDSGSFDDASFLEFREWFLDAKEREDLDPATGSYHWPQELRECAEWLLEQGRSPSSSPLDLLLPFLLTVYSEDDFWNVRLRTELRNSGISVE